MIITTAGRAYDVESLEQLLAKIKPTSPLSFFWLRHDSAVLDVTDLSKLMGYCYGGYDPPLKQKGIDSAKATGELVGDILQEVRTSPLLRAQNTATLVVGHRGIPIYVDWPLRPANYDGVHANAIDRYQKEALAENPDADDHLYQAYLDSGAMTVDRERVVSHVIQTVMEAGKNRLGTTKIIGFIGHDEGCRSGMAFMLGKEPEQFMESACQIERGGYARIRLETDGKMDIIKVSATGEVTQMT